MHGNLPVTGELSSQRQPLSEMLSSKEVARAINRFAREGLDLLGDSNSSALLNFVEEYLCEDDDDDDLSSGKVPHH